MSTTVTIRPIGDMGVAGVWLINGGAGSVHAALSDNSDSTSMQNQFGTSNNDVRLQFGGLSIPANCIVTSVTPRIRCSTGASSQGISLSLIDADGGGMGPVFTVPNNVSSATTFTGYSQAVGPYNIPWGPAYIAGSAYYPQDVIVRVYANDAAAASVVYEVYLDVTYNQAPTATTSALGTISTLKPTISWTYADPDNDPQERFRVKIFSAAQYGAAGFDPNTWTPYIDSGEVFSSAFNWTLTTPLANETAYRAFVFVSDAGSNGRYNTVTSSGPYVSMTTLQIQPPGVPQFNPTFFAQSSDMSYQFDIYDRQNHLPIDDAAFESTIGSWVAVQNCTILRSTAQAEAGAASMAMTATSTSQMIARTGFEPNVNAGTVYSVRAAFYQASNARTVWAEIEFCNNAGTVLTTGGSAVMQNTAGSWSTYIAAATAPAGATQLRIKINVTGHANAEVMYVDNITVLPCWANHFNNPIFEIDTNGDGLADDWSSYTNGTNTVSFALDSTKVYAGLASQKMTLTSGSGFSGTMQSVRFAKQNYACTVAVWVDTNCTIDIYTGTTGSHTQAVTAGSWVSISVVLDYTGITANTSVFESVIIRANANANVWVGAVQIEIGATASAILNLNRKTWTRGGTVSNFWEIQRSADGGVTWQSLNRLEINNTQLFNPATDTQTWRGGDQSIRSIGDYESPRGIKPVYRVRSYIVVLGNTVYSQWSQWVTALTVQPLTDWWFKPINHPATGLKLYLDDDSITWTSANNDQVFWPLGRTGAVVVSDTAHGEQLDINVTLLDETSRKAFEVLRKYQDVVLVQNQYGDEFYMKFVKSRAYNHQLRRDGKRQGVSKVSLVQVDAP